MITSIFILIGATILNIVSVLLSAFSYVIPQQIFDAITYLFSTIHILDGVFPVQTLLLCSTTIVTVWGFVYLARIFLWFIAFIPGVGHHELPSIHSPGEPWESTSRGKVKHDFRLGSVRSALAHKKGEKWTGF